MAADRRPFDPELPELSKFSWPTYPVGSSGLQVRPPVGQR